MGWWSIELELTVGNDTSNAALAVSQDTVGELCNEDTSSVARVGLTLLDITLGSGSLNNGDFESTGIVLGASSWGGGVWKESSCCNTLGRDSASGGESENGELHIDLRLRLGCESECKF